MHGPQSHLCHLDFLATLWSGVDAAHRAWPLTSDMFAVSFGVCCTQHICTSFLQGPLQARCTLSIYCAHRRTDNYAMTRPKHGIGIH